MEAMLSGGSDRALILTNDDGLGAPGLEALKAAVEGLGQATTIAPAGPQSGCGHAVTTHRPIRADRRVPGEFAVEGTPADCVRLALHHLAPEGFDWVLSGINSGGNLGADVFHSGTVAAVREAALHGRPGIALSHYIRRGIPLDWEAAARRARKAIVALLTRPWEPGMFWNVNLPHLHPGEGEPEIVFCDLDPSPLPLAFHLEGDAAQYSGDYHGRTRRPGSDVDTCFGGRIAVSAIRLI